MKTTEQGLVGLTLALIIGGVVLVGGLAYFGLGLDEAENRQAITDEVTNRVDQYNEAADNDQMMNSTSTTGTTSSSSTMVNTGNEVAFTLKMENLSAEQRAFLRLRGIEGDEIEVTNTMVTCAEGKLGRDRVIEIRDGATLTMMEKVQLLTCYE